MLLLLMRRRNGVMAMATVVGQVGARINRLEMNGFLTANTLSRQRLRALLGRIAAPRFSR
jgi:hypothetical protein